MGAGRTINFKGPDAVNCVGPSELYGIAAVRRLVSEDQIPGCRIGGVIPNFS